MPLEIPTLDELRERVAMNIDAAIGQELQRNSPLHILGAVLAGELWQIYGVHVWESRQMLPDTAEAAELDRHGEIHIGGRLPAEPAAGPAIFKGSAGAIVPADTLLRGNAGDYIVTATTPLGAEPTSIPLEAVAGGVNGNLAAGSILTLVEPLAGVEARATVAAPGLTGGRDAEDDARYLARLLARLRMPGHGGAGFDYEDWARAAHPAVTRVWVDAGQMGPGTVTVRFMMDGYREGGFPTEDDVALVFAYIEKRRPKGMGGLYVVAPIPQPLDFEIAIDPDTPAIRAAVEDQLRDLIFREAVPSGTLKRSRWREAVSLATGETDNDVTVPATNVAADDGKLFVLGDITWGGE